MKNLDTGINCVVQFLVGHENDSSIEDSIRNQLLRLFKSYSNIDKVIYEFSIWWYSKQHVELMDSEIYIIYSCINKLGG